MEKYRNCTVEGFVAFIKEQDPKRHVEHTALWNQCAVGDYLRTKGVIRGDADLVVEYWVYSVLAEDSPNLYNLLGNESPIRGDTYGDLQKIIDDYV